MNGIEESPEKEKMRNSIVPKMVKNSIVSKEAPENQRVIQSPKDNGSLREQGAFLENGQV